MYTYRITLVFDDTTKSHVTTFHDDYDAMHQTLMELYREKDAHVAIVTDPTFHQIGTIIKAKEE